MSKFHKLLSPSIVPNALERVRPIKPRTFIDVRFSREAIPGDTIDGHKQTQYDIKAVIGATVWLDNDLTPRREADIRMMRLSIIEEVFGEYREPLMHAMLDINAGETEKALARLQDIYDDMFPRD